MWRTGILLFVVVALAALGLPSAASAACAAPAARPAPTVVLDAVAVTGRATPSGVLASPAKLRVLRYVRGRGPASAQVTTATTLGFHGVVEVMSEAPQLRIGQVVRLFLSGADVRRLHRHRTITLSFCKPVLGRAGRGALRVLPRTSSRIGDWSARVRGGAHGVRCLDLRGVSDCGTPAKHFHGALVTERIVGSKTGVTAWGPGLRRVVVTPTGGSPVSARAGHRPPVFLLDGALQPFDVKVELVYADGTRVVQGDAVRRVTTPDPLVDGRWSAYTATQSGKACAVFDPIGFAATAGDTCRDDAPDGFFAVDTTDPGGRVIVYGKAGRRIASVTLGTGQRTLELGRASRGGAFFAVVTPPADPAGLTITATRSDGTATTFRGQAAGAF